MSDITSRLMSQTPDFPEWDREEAASEIDHLRALLAEAGYRLEAAGVKSEDERRGGNG